ncbi:MAG: hypothetical protein PHS07_02120 [Patescibacteria group bacterium]|nr:hypothetical protein [Patescibacteria group bacterium]
MCPSDAPETIRLFRSSSKTFSMIETVQIGSQAEIESPKVLSWD